MWMQYQPTSYRYPQIKVNMKVLSVWNCHPVYCFGFICKRLYCSWADCSNTRYYFPQDISTGTTIQSVAMFCYDCLLKFRESAWAVAYHRCGQTAIGTFKIISSQTSRLTGWRSLYTASCFVLGLCTKQTKKHNVCSPSRYGHNRDAARDGWSAGVHAEGVQLQEGGEEARARR